RIPKLGNSTQYFEECRFETSRRERAAGITRGSVHEHLCGPRIATAHMEFGESTQYAPVEWKVFARFFENCFCAPSIAIDLFFDDCQLNRAIASLLRRLRAIQKLCLQSDGRRRVTELCIDLDEPRDSSGVIRIAFQHF